jgi:ABC-type Fe3+ transport system substrate-binding protein
MAMDRAPHPNAQKFFLNWWFSREGQIFAQKIEGSNSLRVDISKEDVAPQNLRRKEFTYVFLEKDAGFLPKMKEAVNFARKTMVAAKKR